jgi:nitrile hydratase subunit beta
VSFAPGQRVRVRNDWPEAAGRKVHIRTPHFVRGATGTVERVLGSFGNPERLATGGDGLPKLELYMVCFARADLFPGTASGHETLTADIYETWLEGAP